MGVEPNNLPFPSSSLRVIVHLIVHLRMRGLVGVHCFLGRSGTLVWYLRTFFVGGLVG